MFRNWIESMSALEMASVLFSFGVTIAFIIAIYFTFRGNSASIRAAKIFLKRDSWPGELHNTRIDSWQQTNATYGNNIFLDVFFYLDGTTQLYYAKALLAPGQMHLLRKDLPIVVKKGKKNHIAVMQLGAWEVENATSGKQKSPAA